MKSPIALGDLVGKRIALKLSPAFPDELIGPVSGIHKTDGWWIATLLGVDGVGIWVENPEHRYTAYRDKAGRPIPAGERKETVQSAAVLLLWQYLLSITYFKNLDRADDATYTPIGFRQGGT
jgi:hypothetical protein